MGKFRVGSGKGEKKKSDRNGKREDEREQQAQERIILRTVIIIPRIYRTTEHIYFYCCYSHTDRNVMETPTIINNKKKK